MKENNLHPTKDETTLMKDEGVRAQKTVRLEK
jgi:hypothetical protein